MPSAPFRALAPAVMLVLPWLLPVPELPVLAPGETVERELAGGDMHSFRLEVQTGKPLLVTVEQHGINVILSWQDASGKPLGMMNTALERDGVETLLVEGAEGAYRLEVRSPVAEVPAGRFRVRIDELLSATSEDQTRIEAERLMTGAGLLFSQENEEAQRQALAAYGKARSHWRKLERKPEEARTLIRLAIVHMSLSESQAALDRLQEALALYSSLQDSAREADILTYMGLAQSRLSRYQEAITSFNRSLEIRRALDNRYGEAITSQNLCTIRLYLGEYREAIPCFESALRLLEEVREPDAIADALNGLGGAHSNLGEPRKAREHYNHALEKKRSLKNQAAEAKILNNLAVLAADQGSMGEALAFYGQALEVFEKLGDREWQGRALANLGNAYLSLGETQRARGYFEKALPMRRGLQDRRGEVNTLCSLGLAQEQLEEISSALRSYEEALTIAQAVGYRAGEASALNLLAQGHLKAGDPAKALELFARAAILQRGLGNLSGVALARQRTGEAEARLGQSEKAVVTIHEATDLYRVLEDRSGQAGSLASLAAVERGMGRLDDALAHAEKAIEFVESVRATVGDPSLRASFLASQRLAFELAVGLRMDLDRKQPGKGHVELALALSERARARSLLDLLHEAGRENRRGLDPNLRERKESLALRFSVNARMRRGAATDEQRTSLQRELVELLAEADRLEEEIRRRSPRYAGLIQPLDAAGIRKLLDTDTLLLEYTLGEEKSFLWAVTSERVDGFELPGRTEIESAARRSYEEVRKTEDTESEVHRTLSRILLGPVADRLPGQRLVIVADGALQYVPFSVLPDPGDPTGGTPLVVGHEIVSLPSASVLDIQRRVLTGRPRAEKAIAVLADPVFVPWDNRLRGAASAAAHGMPVETPRIQRLPASGREAKAIAALLPPDQVFMALDFQASRGTALSGILARFRAVHFATHGWIDSETPRLSGLTLSMVDEKGQAQEGLLSLSDIYNLELGADLVVLSGCETALGREIRGEGLMGLTQGFLYAGSERVMASLWLVEDRATAELMTRFYRSMLQEGLPPAAALRSAQLAIRSDPRWQDPFYWAPFVLQGDWR
ncbi:MAG TPA: CHAT domain-containing tetratricopeptide repeat protein [Thermoanaerobaculia bacterium]|nr:CHAT domain-containing tetratricopeptide repeat protein [Thermoanaerobaculia bacterium]